MDFPSFITGLLIVAAVPLHGQTTVEEAQRLLDWRHKDKSWYGSCRKLMDEVIIREPSNVKAHWLMAKIILKYASTRTVKKEKIALYEQGRDAAKMAIAIDSSCAEAFLWYTANIGRIGQTKGVMNSLAMVPEIRKGIKRALALDPKLTGALDVQGMLFFELPSFMGGNLDSAAFYFQKGIIIDPHHTLLKIDLARVYIRRKQHDKARALLNEVIAITGKDEEADYVLDDRPTAMRLLTELADQ